VVKTAVLSQVRVGGGCKSDKTDVFSTRIKNKVDFFFFFGHEVCFSETAFSASALERYDKRQIEVMPKPSDREDDYRCLSPPQRKTSELEGEEEYTSIFRTLQAHFPEFT
jgi:hypothetical protein